MKVEGCIKPKTLCLASEIGAPSRLHVLALSCAITLRDLLGSLVNAGAGYLLEKATIGATIGTMVGTTAIKAAAEVEKDKEETIHGGAMHLSTLTAWHLLPTPLYSVPARRTTRRHSYAVASSFWRTNAKRRRKGSSLSLPSRARCLEPWVALPRGPLPVLWSAR